jgi:hypothetical protein
MAICTNIVEGHLGDSYVMSEVGIGTLVNIWLPTSPDTHLVKG